MPVVDGIIQLYEVREGGLPSPLRFCNYSQAGGGDVFLGGVRYLAYPIQSASGWERSLDGALPRPTITLSNIFSDITALVNQYGGIDAKLTRRTVLFKNLDGGSDPDPTAILKEEIYYVTRFAWNNQTSVMHLRSPLDTENLKLPRRTVGSVLG
ncbi:MAG TPA: hypothetical protein VLL52_25870 [Anaerolineae bacterium]|nr:hypothetical protein [Anaerolineae bacterium]